MKKIIFVLLFINTLILSSCNYSEKKETTIKIDTPGLTVESNENIIINYPLFTENGNIDGYIKKIKNAEKNQEESFLKAKVELKPSFQLIILNISGDNLDFISKINSRFNIDYITLYFDSYNDDNFRIFNSIFTGKNIKELSLYFNNPLKGNNSLIKTLALIENLGNSKINQFYINGKEDFMNDYKMSKDEFETVIKIPLFILSLENSFNDNISSEYILNSLEKTSIEEYNIGNKVSKFNGVISNNKGDRIN